MGSTTFTLLGVSYYLASVIIIIIVLNKINKKDRNKYLKVINELEKNKNLIISSGILTELNNANNLVNNKEMQEMYDDWKKRFNYIKEVEIPKITDSLIEIQDLFDNKKYKDLNKLLAKTELNIDYVKTKSNYLLNEIKKVTTSSSRSREEILKLKQKYREIITKYNNNKSDYSIINGPIELQFENVDKLFSHFEVAIDENNYQETSKVLNALNDIVGNLDLIIKESPSIILLGTKLLPSKMQDVYVEADKLRKDGYNLDYLNIEYNYEEANKKIADVLERINVLNIEDSLLTLKTLLDYFDGLYGDFEKEVKAKKSFKELTRSILVRSNKYERINNELRKRGKQFIYSYDLTEDDIKILDILKEEIKEIKHDYDEIIEASRSKKYAYSRLDKEMKELNTRLSKCGNNLEYALHNLGSLKEDELRANDQLEEIKSILKRAKYKISSYKIPVVPRRYYIELSEASVAIKNVVTELEKKPISIKTLNIRVDTARDLVLKLYNTSNEIIRTAQLAETSIVYGNRYRSINKGIDDALTKKLDDIKANTKLTNSERFFNNGEYKNSLEYTINAINRIEPDFYQKLKETLENK